MKITYIIDGTKFSSLGGFFRQVSKNIIPGYIWGEENLDAFNDILRGRATA